MTMLDSQNRLEWPLQLRRFRRFHALKQAALAEIVGVDQATISRWEGGRAMPDLAMQRRLRDVVRKMPTAESIANHSIEMALGQVAIVSPRRMMVAASKTWSDAHGIPHGDIRGRHSQVMYTDEGERIWRLAYDHGLYKGNVASVTVVTRGHSLSGHVRNRFIKAVWTPLRMSDNEIFLHLERADLTEKEYLSNREDMAGPARIVTMDSLVG